jgi:perosamine synthetase
MTILRAEDASRRGRSWRAGLALAFDELKRARTEDELIARAIPFGDDAGCLVPFCRMHAEDASTIALLSCWRVRNMAAYPTQFTVTDAGTSAWLRDRVLGVPDRELWLIRDPAARAIGTVGLHAGPGDERSLVLESFMRGSDTAPRWTVRAAAAALIDWAIARLRPERIGTTVFADNRPIISLLSALGLEEDGVIPLRKIVDGDRTEFVPVGDGGGTPDRYHLRMLRVIEVPTGREG